MLELPPQLVRLLVTGLTTLVGFLAPTPAATVAPLVPVVRTAAERAESGGERVRRIPAPPRRGADARSGRNTTVTPDDDAPTGGAGGAPRADRERGTRADTEPSPGRGGATSGGSRVSGGSGSGGPTAAATHGWGTPTRVDEFEGDVGGDWGIYDGSGHDGNGRRSPSAVSVADGIMTITGTPDGTTGGMAWNPGRMYGRWEARVRSPAGDPDYHSVLLLWPDAENWPVGGEVDFMEISDASRQNVEMFLHYGADNSQVQGDVDIDATEWHTWAVEWTPDHIAAFVDGEEWWRTDDTGILPPGPMHLTIQLDNFGSPGQETQMHVDWVREYDV